MKMTLLVVLRLSDILMTAGLSLHYEARVPYQHKVMCFLLQRSQITDKLLGMFG